MNDFQYLSFDCFMEKSLGVFLFGREYLAGQLVKYRLTFCHLSNVN